MKYINFLYQWIDWLLKSDNITGTRIENKVEPDEVNLRTMHTHLNNLKLFNFSINQNLNGEVDDNLINSTDEVNSKLLTLRNVLAENSNFLESISKS